jgi:hypothetical protein
MKSAKPGKTTSTVEVQHVSAHGFWLFVEATAREYFLPFSEFPQFKQTTIADILAVELKRNHILHWSKLDVDPELGQLAEPTRHPLVARTKRANSGALHSWSFDCPNARSVPSKSVPTG